MSRTFALSCVPRTGLEKDTILVEVLSVDPSDGDVVEGVLLMPKMVESVSLDYVMSLEKRIDALERKVHAPPVDESHVDVVHPVVVVDESRPIIVEEVNPVDLNESRLYKRPLSELKLPSSGKDSQPKVSRDDLGVNMD